VNYGKSNTVIKYSVRYTEGQGKDAEFLYDAIDKYTDGADEANKRELANTWRKIKADRLNHINLLKGALEKEIQG
jgi:hypothetical protein